MTGGDLISRVIVPLLCGAAGGLVVSLSSGSPGQQPDAAEVAAPEAAPQVAAPAPSEASADCAAVRRELGVLSRSIDELRRDRSPSQSAPDLLADGGSAVLERMEKQQASLQAKFAERRDEQNRSRAANDLAELKTILKNTPEEQTQKNVETWIRKLGFNPEDQQRIAKASVPYVRRRSEAIISLVEQAAQGRAPSSEDMTRQLRALEASFETTLPGTLDPEARAAVVGAINGRVRMPFYLQR